MYLINLFPYFARNNPVSYSWIGPICSSKLGSDNIILVGSKLQLLPPSKQSHNAWIADSVKEISDEVWENILKIEVPDSLLDELYDQSGDGLSFLNQISTVNYSNYVNFLLEQLVLLRISKRIFAGISLVNDKSFHTVCQIIGIPIIYSEAGPIRTPGFSFGTYFFDFSGVNGNHSFEITFPQSKIELDKDKFLPTSKILDNLYGVNYGKHLNSEAHDYEIGVALQVEDDSNLISFSNGFDSLRLLFKALWVFLKI